MKKYRFTTFFVLIAVVAGILVGCEEYLTELPDNRTILDERQKIVKLLASAYPDAHHAMFTMPMSDNAEDKGSEPTDIGYISRRINQLSYRWENVNYNANTGDSPSGYWVGCYFGIANANHALQAIEELKEVGEEDSTSLAPLRGEALLARAYAHFMLVNLWGKSYDSTTADKDLGVPYVLEPENVAIKARKRLTVKEVYDSIERDMLEGLPLLTNDYEHPKFHFTPEAAKGFATRFYLYKGKWKKVIHYANQILSPDGANIRDLNTSDYQEGTYAELSIGYTASAQVANLLVTSVGTIYARFYASLRYGMTTRLRDMLFSNSTNVLQGDSIWHYRTFGTDLHRNTAKFQEYFKYTNRSARIGDAYGAFVLLSYDEVLLNRAEAYVMTNQFALARADMALFLSKKSKALASDAIDEDKITKFYPRFKGVGIKPFYSLSALQESYVKAITDIRRRAFMQEGVRWFDIRRFHMEVVHTFSEGGRLILTGDDERRELQIPESAVVLGMKPNP